MRVAAENYKGIEFVRISMLPEDQKKMIWTSLKREKIIKILKQDCLLNDCIQMPDYEAWYTENYKVESVTIVASNSQSIRKPEYKLAFK
ncbi:MAG: hypothetical protein JJE09_03655 [Bacteroidia bacterium]|nr:hypothetical protein [Bacteroidia bacterium]